MDVCGSFQLRYAGRGVSALPAAGIGNVHKREMEEILQQTFQKW